MILNKDYLHGSYRDNTVVRNGRLIYVKKLNMTKESWQRAFLEELLKKYFPDADYLPTKVNGKYVDYTFYLGNDEFGLEIKNINPKGEFLGRGFTEKEIVARFTDEKFRGLLLSCRGFTDNARDLLEKENIPYVILPNQTTPSMSLKQRKINERVTVAFLKKHLEYSNPIKKSEKTESCPKSTNLSIPIDTTNNINLYLKPYQMEDFYQFSSYWTKSESSRNRFRVIFFYVFSKMVGMKMEKIVSIPFLKRVVEWVLGKRNLAKNENRMYKGGRSKWKLKK